MSKHEPSNQYLAVHSRIRARRGRAGDHTCIAEGCDTKARTWAWQRTGPYMEAEPTRTVNARRWGTQIEDYEPMCMIHATQLDRGGTLTHCPAGHLRTVENTYTYPGRNANECRDCKRDARAARNALKIRKPCPECGKSISEGYMADHIKNVHGNTTPENREEQNHD